MNANSQLSELKWYGPYTATSFADPADLRAFRKCKSRGRTNQACYRVGDNGTGKWGADCASPARVYIALPPEAWLPAGMTGESPVLLRYHGKIVQAYLGDTMPHEEAIHNGARLDLAPGALAAYGLRAPYMGDGWEWAWGAK